MEFVDVIAVQLLSQNFMYLEISQILLLIKLESIHKSKSKFRMDNCQASNVFLLALQTQELSKMDPTHNAYAIQVSKSNQALK